MLVDSAITLGGRTLVAGRINEEDIQALRERADIAVVAGDYTALKRSGAKLRGLCPFHAEKTPSFYVDQAKGFFHCFGCDEGGDVYAFLQKIEALSFPEAVERLARLVGFSLRYEELSPGQRKALGRRTRLSECVGEAAGFYADQLMSALGQVARDYLASRDMRGDEVEHFGLGWAPDDWDTLVRHLQQQGFTPDEIIDAGLATKGSRGPIDRFRGRVMFPIYDAGGRDVVAFGGRVLPGLALRTGPRDGAPPKYINSPETEVYKKSRTLYGLNWARAEIQRRDTALVVEGYMDVIGLHRAGVRHAVATCGTALTADHFRQLEKFSGRVVLALDADEAGFTAADRARGLAEEVGVREVGVLPLPSGQDPADLAARGAEEVERALTGIATAVEFQITYLLRSAQMSTPEGQVDAYRRTFPLLARLPDRFLRYSYIRDIVAPAVRLSADLIERELDLHLATGQTGTVAAAAGGAGRRQERSVARPRRAVGHGSVAGPRPAGRQHAAGPRDPQLNLERQVLQAALQHPELLPAAWDKLTEDDFVAPASRQLFTVLGQVPRGDFDAVLAALPDDGTRSRVRGLALSDSVGEADTVKVADLIASLRSRSIERRIADTKADLRRVNAATDRDKHRSLMVRLVELEGQRREYREGRRA